MIDITKQLTKVACLGDKKVHYVVSNEALHTIKENFGLKNDEDFEKKFSVKIKKDREFVGAGILEVIKIKKEFPIFNFLNKIFK